MNLLRVYLPAGTASASAAIAGMAGAASIPHAASWALLAAAGVMAIGSAFCMRAMSAARITLPGRDPDFWLYALEPAVSRQKVIDDYLKALVERAKNNKDMSDKAAIALKYAKWCVVGSFLTAAMAGAIALRI